MATRLQSASGLGPLPGSADFGPSGSHIALSEGRLPEVPASNLPRGYNLPERYGMPLLELLVVDPEFIFVSWEITDDQLTAARARFGKEGFQRRRLRIELFDTGGSAPEPLAARELYGEVGRWFIQLGRPDVWLRAELKFIYGGESLLLGQAGSVFVPREEPVEPTDYLELRVRYGRGSTGELTLEGFEEAATGWPSVTLGGPGSGSPRLGRLDGGSAAALFSSGRDRHVDARLLRPLLPVAPAMLPAVEEEEKE